MSDVAVNNLELVRFLDHYGHLRSPFGEPREITTPVEELKLGDQVVRDAIESFQSFHAPTLSPLLSAFYPRRLDTAVKVSGTLDVVTQHLMRQERCACPDYDMALPEYLVGAGNWKSCNNIGKFHNAVVEFMNTPPSFLQPFMEEIWQRVVDSYAELGLLFTRKVNSNEFTNIELSFVQPDGSWIGLAIVGQGQGCQDTIWCRFDKNYKPASLVSEWTTLIKHELGHNCGLSHSSGGVMNPYIVAGLPVSWKGDVSYNLLKSRFGGEAIPSSPVNRKMVLAWKDSNGNYRDIIDVDTSGGTEWWPN